MRRPRSLIWIKRPCALVAVDKTERSTIRQGTGGAIKDLNPADETVDSARAFGRNGPTA
jgi:hypothetical protein